MDKVQIKVSEKVTGENSQMFGPIIVENWTNYSIIKCADCGKELMRTTRLRQFELDNGAEVFDEEQRQCCGKLRVY